MHRLSFLSLTSLAATAFAATAEEWRSRSIYQLLTDRFALTNGSDIPCDTPSRKYCGGTWEGIINQLDYIQDMGFDAVWISPVVKNIEGTTGEGQAFHGYWTEDMTTINPHFGVEDDLKALSAALHSRGMYLMLDVVVNHMATAGLTTNFTGYAPFSNTSSFHPQCWITDYNNQTNVEQCWLGDTSVALPDINTEDQSNVDILYDWVKNLVAEYKVDGVRIDTVKHIRKDFWPGFASAAGVFTIGEVLDGDPDYVAPYTQVLDAVLDYPTYFQLFNAFTNVNKTGNISALADYAQQVQSKFKNGAMMTGSFLENHDQPRFQSVTKDASLVRNAMAWNFVNDGIPIMYYGQEQGYTGGTDPDNREALWFTHYTQDADLVNYVRALNMVRKAAIDYQSSFLTTPMKILVSTDTGLALSKPPLTTLLTNSGQDSTALWEVPTAGYQPNEYLMDIVQCTPLQANGYGGLEISSYDGLPQVIVPRAALQKSGLCNVTVEDIAQESGARGAVGVSGLWVSTVALAVGALVALLG